ncbi:MAG: hypothetical protein QOE26_1362 [Verrucomicrobiota bacterium]|jgi:hypothetical protein
MLDYRRTLQAAEDASHTDYDKAVLTLSGGALGITFAFFKEIAARLGTGRPVWLIAAWIAWCTSLAAILVSFYTAGKANRKAIQQVDQNTVPDKPGGGWDRATRRLNFIGGACFLLGAIFAICFIYQAFGHNEQRTPSTPYTTPAAAPAAAAAATAAPAAIPNPSAATAATADRPPGR